MDPTLPKRLIIRLSSMGDVILATSALSVNQGPGETHWVVAKEYAGLLRGHPRLAKVWEFDRKEGGLLAWLKLCARLWDEGFTEVLDLHNSWRSRAARAYFLFRSGLSSRPVRWRAMNKERLRLNGLFLLKRAWPKAWQPTPVVRRSALTAGGAGSERPDLSYLVGEAAKDGLPQDWRTWAASQPTGYLCVMPSSKWAGKNWGVRNFFEVISNSGLGVLVLGEKSDRESRLLVKTLEQAGFPHYDGIGAFSYTQLASAMAGARAYLGNDTGLAHLSEAVGTAVVTVFGPTEPAIGFGPWREESRAVGINLWCKPCGKDGRTCYRWGDRYACQKKLRPSRVLSELRALLGQAGDPGA